MLKKIILSVLAFVLLAAYPAYRFVTQAIQQKLMEYPWWEDYADYQESTWIKLVDAMRISLDGCVSYTGTDDSGWFTLKNELVWCLDASDPYRHVLTRTVKGRFGVTLSQKSWEHTETREGFRKVREEFPNGPIAFVEPKRWLKKFYQRYIGKYEFQKNFLNAVRFNEEGHALDSQPIWNQPMVVKFFDLSNGQKIDGKTLSEQGAEFLARLKKITNHDIRVAKNGEIPNHLVFFYYRRQAEHREQVIQFIRDSLAKLDLSRRADSIINNTLAYFHQNPRAQCAATAINAWRYESWGRTEPPGSYLVALSFIFLDDKDENGVIACIHEEITQGMGISNDVRETEPTIFNDFSPYNRLTALDELMLKMIYLDVDVEGLEKIYPELFDFIRVEPSGYKDIVKIKKYMYSFFYPFE